MKYRDLVNKYCGNNWNKISEADKHAGLGIACMLAYLHGAAPRLLDLAKHLKVTPAEIKRPFENLSRSGVFNKEAFGAKEDKALMGDAEKEEVLNAWGYIGGIAGGFIYRSYSKFKFNFS